MRKGFNFYRSFLDVAIELPAKYRGEFLFAICDLQLNGNSPDFSKSPAILKMAWASVKHSLEKQLTGYNTATNEHLPYEGAKEGSSEGYAEGTKHQEQEQEQEEYKSKSKRTSKKKDSLSVERPRNVFGDVFCDWFLAQNGTAFNMQKKDWVGISSIEKYCEENFKNIAPEVIAKNNYQPIDTFKAILANYSVLPVFFQENKNPAFIASKIAEIISLIKRPAQKQTKQDSVIMMQGDKTNPETGEYETAKEKIFRESQEREKLKIAQ